MSESTYHNKPCENAMQAACKCGQCGGSMHGVSGCIALSRGPAEERRRRLDELDSRLDRVSGGRALKGSKKNRNAVAKICVVEISEGVAASSRSGGNSLGGPGPDADQIEAVANLLTRDVWPAARDAINEASRESGLDPEAVRKSLANHGWCDLIVGIIQVVEVARGVVGIIESGARDAIVRAIMQSSMQSRYREVVERVVEVLVDKVCTVFFETLKQAASPLGILANEDLLRALRIIAVFICPGPSTHVEVRKHALAPLGEDVKGYLTGQTKEYLGQVFVD